MGLLSKSCTQLLALLLLGITDNCLYRNSWNFVISSKTFCYFSQHCRSDWRAPVVAFLVQAFTFWKTVLYMIQYTPLCNGSHLVEHLDWLKYTALFLGTNGWWIVIPLLSLWTLWKTLLSAMAPSAGETDKTK